jgi:hypothetical protein
VAAAVALQAKPALQQLPQLLLAANQHPRQMQKLQHKMLLLKLLPLALRLTWHPFPRLTSLSRLLRLAAAHL